MLNSRSGGTDRFTRELRFEHIINAHQHLKISDEQRDRFVTPYLWRLSRAHLPDGEPFRSHVEFAPGSPSRKTTVYRWWPTKAALVIEAVSLALPTPTHPDTGDLRQDLLIAVRRGVQTMVGTRVGAVIPALAADVMSDPQLAEQFHNQLIRPRRSAVVEILLRAVDRGELPPDVDTDLLLDVYAGAVFYRTLISGEPATDLLAQQLVDLLLEGKTPVKPHRDDPENRTA